MNKAHEDIVRTVERRNLQRVLERGEPSLSHDCETVIVARDSARDCVLVGGMGALGVGRMWVEREARHNSYPGISTAPESAVTSDYWMENLERESKAYSAIAEAQVVGDSQVNW